MSILSTHIPQADLFDPNRINILIEDLRVNHNHAGGAEGAQVDHATLLNRGSQTHVAIDSHIADPMHGYIRKVARGSRVNSPVSNWGVSPGGGEWYNVNVNFSEDTSAPMFTVAPVVTASITSWKRVYPVVKNVTPTGFTLELGNGHDSFPESGGTISFNWIAVGV